MESNTICKHSDRPQTDEDVKAAAGFPYRQVVGSLMYLMVGTRPDQATLIRETSQHLTNPGKAHRDVLKRALCYLRGTSTHGITLAAVPMVLRCYNEEIFCLRPVMRVSLNMKIVDRLPVTFLFYLEHLPSHGVV